MIGWRSLALRMTWFGMLIAIWGSTSSGKTRRSECITALVSKRKIDVLRSWMSD